MAIDSVGALHATRVPVNAAGKHAERVNNGMNSAGAMAAKGERSQDAVIRPYESFM
jgi:hypothetical protein